MDNIYENRPESRIYPDEMEPWLDEWFLVSGDMDDFIFYDEPDRTLSEK